MWRLLRNTNPSSHRRGGPISKHINDLGTNVNLVMSLDGAETKNHYADAMLFGDLETHRKSERAAEIWTWTEADISRLRAAEVGYVRHIAGRIRSENIKRFLLLSYSFIYSLTYSAA
jgi:hypothetical protein